MSRKHFRAIASTLRDGKPNATNASANRNSRRDWVRSWNVQRIADALASFNPRFNESKFRKALRRRGLDRSDLSPKPEKMQCHSWKRKSQRNRNGFPLTAIAELTLCPLTLWDKARSDSIRDVLAIDAETPIESLLPYVRDYIESSSVTSIEIVKGYGVRSCRTGYLDCTPWEVFTTKREALAAYRQHRRECAGQDE